MGFTDFVSDAGLTSKHAAFVGASITNLPLSRQQLPGHEKLHRWVRQLDFVQHPRSPLLASPHSMMKTIGPCL